VQQVAGQQSKSVLGIPVQITTETVGQNFWTLSIARNSMIRDVEGLLGQRQMGALELHA
jgi:DNA primase